MFDDLDRLRNNFHLLELFHHYARLGEPKREIRHPRLSEMDGVQASEMTKLHRELIAFEWIESNVGAVPCSYRITQAGMRALRQLQSDPSEEIEKLAA